MAEKNYITVSELNFYINRLVSGEELLQNIPVLGEVSGISVSGANLYFTIKDQGAQLQACYFNFGKGYVPTDGEQVLLLGSPDFYAKGGRLSFIVNKIEPFGIGKLFAQLEKLKQRLASEGLFDALRKRRLPLYPTNIGVVTSATGAVIHDIVNTFRRHNSASDIAIINVAVQGEGAIDAICEGLNLADKQGFDVVILARGGGSFEDLLPFNSERVARAVYNMKTVTVSAVGHETDFSLADLAADYRAMTPTAAAETLAFDANALSNEIMYKIIRLADMLTAKTDAMHGKVQSRTKEVTYICTARLEAYAKHINNSLAASELLMQAKITDKERRIDMLTAKLSALNPANLLSKGYFRVMKGDKDIQKLGLLAVGDDIRIYGTDGRIDARVTDKSIADGAKQ